MPLLFITLVIRVLTHVNIVNILAALLDSSILTGY